MLAFCWPVIGKEWIAGKLYAHGTAPSLGEVYDILEDQPRRSKENEEGVDEMDSPGSHKDDAGKRPEPTRKSRRLSLSELRDSVSVHIFDKGNSNSISDTVTGSCTLRGLVLKWSQENPDSDHFIRARWTLCTESEHKQQAAAKAAELASAPSGEEAATMVVEEIVQLQFFHPLFRKYDGACEFLRPFFSLCLLVDPPRHGLLIATNVMIRVVFRLAICTKSECSAATGASLVRRQRTKAWALEITARAGTRRG